MHNYPEMLEKTFSPSILRLLCVNKKISLFSCAWYFYLINEKFNIKIHYPEMESQTIESKLGSRNHSVPSVVGMGNIKLFADLSPYTKYKFTLHEIAGNLRGNSTSITVNTSEGGKKHMSFPVSTAISKRWLKYQLSVD